MEFLEAPLFDDDIFKMMVRFGINLIFLTMLLFFAIRPAASQREYLFTVVMLNVIVFFICFTMKKLELDLGLALGLFAVFGVLRYRTDSLKPKEMTYLFIVIGLALINALSNKKTSYAEVLLVNTLIVGIAVFKESYALRSSEIKSRKKERGESKKGKQESQNESLSPKPNAIYRIEYDRLEWLGDSHRDELLADLKQRTGINVSGFKIRKIDLLKKKACLEIWIHNDSQMAQVG